MPIAPNEPFAPDDHDANAAEEQNEIQRLAAFGDALMDDAASPPRNATEATMLHVQRTFALPVDETPIPPAIKASIQEAIMQHVSAVPTVPPSIPTSTPKRERGSSTPIRARRLPTTVRSWSATASLSVMIALVVGLVGVLVALRFDAPDPKLPPTATLGQAVPNPTYPSLPEQCVPNGAPITSNDDVKGKSLSDWPKPIYAPAKPVTYEQGLAIQQTYLNFMRCLNEAYPASPVSTDTQFTPNSLSYYSDRMRFIIANAQGAWYEPADAPYDCQSRVNELMASFPLPVNKPTTAAISKLGASGDVLEYAPIFAPSDVYLMPDGRYGVILGTVSTAALQNPDVLSAGDSMQFIAFKKDGDHFLIDESIILLMPDLAHPIVEHGEGTPVPTEATFPRSKAPACLAY